MSDTEPQAADWPVLLGQMVLAKQQINERDPEQLEPYTLPRVAATEDEVSALEKRVGERLDDHYRAFLLHANGWLQFYFNVGLFGIPELDGGGDWSVAQELLDIYNAEEELAEADLDPQGVMPIAAGEGMRHLIVIVRPGWPDAGTVVWFDGGEIFRADTFVDFFEEFLATEQAQASQLAEDQAQA